MNRINVKTFSNTFIFEDGDVGIKTKNYRKMTSAMSSHSDGTLFGQLGNSAESSLFLIQDLIPGSTIRNRIGCGRINLAGSSPVVVEQQFGELLESIEAVSKEKLFESVSLRLCDCDCE